MNARPIARLAALLLAGGALPPEPAAAQRDCKMLFCSPQLSFLPTVALLPLGEPARTAPVRIGGGQRVVGEPSEGETDAEFAVVFNLGVPSTIPRTSFFAEVIWLPFREGEENPFTEYAAGGEAIDDDGVDQNMPTLEFGASFLLLPMRQTGGWLSLALNAVDQLGPAAEPDDARAYTHKLNLEADATLTVFNWLPDDNWLTNVKAYATLDYTATGLAGEGDVVPAASPGDPGRIYLEDANPWSVWIGLSIPVAPIAPQ